MAAVGLTSTISATALETCLLYRAERAGDCTKNGTVRVECCQSNGDHKETCEFRRDVRRDGR